MSLSRLYRDVYEEQTHVLSAKQSATAGESFAGVPTDRSTRQVEASTALRHIIDRHRRSGDMYEGSEEVP